MLVMRALSLGLVKGTIDEVDESVHMTWVQPRVLNTEQVKDSRLFKHNGLHRAARDCEQYLTPLALELNPIFTNV